MPQATVTVPFRVRTQADPNGFAYLEDSPVHISAYGSDAKVKREIRAALIPVVTDALAVYDNRFSRHYIGAADGTVLLIACGGADRWHYEIAGPGRQHCGAVLGTTTKNESIDKARRHAQQCYGGIAWEHS